MAGWADYNLSDGEFANKQLFTTMTGLRNALKERLNAIGDTLSGSVTVPEHNKLPTKSWLNSFQGDMSSAIARYINHTDNSGDWEGESTIPDWTENSIIAAIGDPERYSVPDIPLAKWAKQQYDIINLLRWATGVSARQVPWKQKEVTPGSGSWADVVTAFNNASYVNSTTNLRIFRRRKNSGGGGTIDHVKIFYTLTRQDDSGQFGADYDLYQKFTLNNGNTSVDIYSSADGYLQDKHYKQETGSFAVSTYSQSSAEKAVTIDYSEPGTEDKDIGLVASTNQLSTGTTLVLKFDGANGFEYKDW